jgi:uncharacterized Zn finger protein (UPF0148 family)
MVYTCENCGFSFSRAGEATECPSCEKTNIRPATKVEAQKLKKVLEQEKQILRNKEESFL